MKIGFLTALFIVFLVLKLCGIIAWSWWWVTSPLWIGLLLITTAIIVVSAISVCRRH